MEDQEHIFGKPLQKSYSHYLTFHCWLIPSISSKITVESSVINPPMEKAITRVEKRRSTIKKERTGTRDEDYCGPGLDNTRLFMSLTAGAGTRCMSLLSSSLGFFPSSSGLLFTRLHYISSRFTLLLILLLVICLLFYFSGATEVER